MSIQPDINIMWFRRDLRLKDNAGLYHALTSGLPVLPIFIFDTEILDQLEDKTDARVSFIHQALQEMQTELLELGSSLEVLHGKPLDCIKALTKKYAIGTVFINHDYEPSAIQRDAAIEAYLGENIVGFKSYKDQVILEKEEVLKDDGTPYTVFTPYSRKWKSKLTDEHLKAYPVEKYQDHFFKQAPIELPSLESIGFTASNYFSCQSMEKRNSCQVQ